MKKIKLVGLPVKYPKKGSLIIFRAKDVSGELQKLPKKDLERTFLVLYSAENSKKSLKTRKG